MDKIIVYERLKHKETLYKDYVNNILSQSQEMDDQLKDLLNSLIMTDDNDYEHLAELMHDDNLVEKIKDAHNRISRKTNLASNISDVVYNSIGKTKFLGNTIPPLSKEELLGIQEKQASASEKLDIHIDKSILEDKKQMLKLMKSKDYDTQQKLIDLADEKDLITLLHMAIDCDNVHAVADILKKDTEIIESNLNGKSPLVRAMSKNTNDMVRLLLEHDANLYRPISNKDKSTAYLYAFLYKIPPEIFMSPLSDINKKDDSGNNFLVYSVRFQNEEGGFEWMHEAKKKGADFLSTDNQGSSLTEILMDSHYADHPDLCMEGIETILEIVQNDPAISEEDKLNMLSDVLKQASKYNNKPIQSAALKYCSEENLHKLSQLSGIENLPKIAPTKMSKESNNRPNLQWTNPKSTKSEEVSTNVTNFSPKK